MMRFDDEVKRALGRMDPPEGFAERVMARIGADDRRPAPRAAVVPFPRRFSRGFAAAAAVASIVIGAGMYQVHQQQRNERIEGMRARQEVLLALSIASEKTSIARQAVIEP